MTGRPVRPGDAVNLPFVTAADLADRAERASARLDGLFRLSTLAHEIRTDADHPIVSAAFWTVDDRITGALRHARAVADYARQAVTSGALTGVPPVGDTLNQRELTGEDLRARVDRASAAYDAARRVLDLAQAHADEATDPGTRAAWWEVYQRAADGWAHAADVSDRAWHAWTDHRDRTATGTADRQPVEVADPAAGLDPDTGPAELAAALGLDPDDPSLDDDHPGD